jgi:ATP-dependent helicase/nuclease subunit A
MLAGVDDLGRSFDPGDVLILLRKRKSLFEAIIRALKHAGVPVAGMDRLSIKTHIAAQDMIAIGRAALLPDDDLTLATMLKTPVFGLDDAALIAIAPERSGSLLHALQSSDLPQIMEAARFFSEIRIQAKWQGPFGFYAWLLGPAGGRKRMTGRLGSEANDVLDIWLSTALEYENSNIPSLTGFLDAAISSDQTIKRDMATAAGEVRVMTIHGAKGLEAPIVFVPDIGAFSRSQPPRTVSCIDLPLRAGDVVAVPVWTPKKSMLCAAAASARLAEENRDLEEHNRLLYVALTRAEDRLILAGAYKNSQVPDESWRTSLNAAFEELAVSNHENMPVVVQHDAPLDRAFSFLRYQLGSSRSLEGGLAETIPQPKTRSTMPYWLAEKARTEAVNPPPLTPSSALAAADAQDRPTDRNIVTKGVNRGRLVHDLLQYLPEIPAHTRKDAAIRIIKAQSLIDRADHATQIVDDVLSLLENPKFAVIFGASSFAEIPISGQIIFENGTLRDVSGRIDRITILPDQIIIADYKTMPHPPRNQEAIPHKQLVQMAIYRDLVRRIIPDKPVRSFLIYTSGPVALEIDPDRLTASLKALS